MKKAVGIDLGTTNSVVAFKDTEVKIIRSHEDDELVRSCVSMIRDEILVGNRAYNYGFKGDPENTILSVKRLMGGAINGKMVQLMIANKSYYKYVITELRGGTDDAVAVLLGGKQFTPEQISAEILKKLKRDAEEKLGDEITHAVITVPAYFTEKQKNATKIAAQLAGLKVQKLLAEPTAAAIAYGVDKLKIGDSKTVLIYDFGGGTFDLSILNIVDGQYMETGTGGDRWLGGDDIDRKLEELVYKKVEQEYHISDINSLLDKLSQKKRNNYESAFRNEVEEAKKQLSSVYSTPIDVSNYLKDENDDYIDIEVEITREEFENLVKPFIQRSIDLIEELFKGVGYDISMIDHILLVGGTSCIPMVRNMLSEKYGADKIKISERPMLAIAEGAGILSHRLGDEYEQPIEITSTVDEISYSANHNYFIEYQTIEGSIDYKLIVEKQNPLPVSVSIPLKTMRNKQEVAYVSIWADVEGGEKERQTTGYFTIDKELAIQSEIIFNIRLNVDETFEISAYPKDYKESKKDIVIGRGNKDSKAFKTIEKHTEELLQNIYSWRAQDKYFKLQKGMIKLAEEISNDDPSGNKWSEIDFKIKNAYDEAVKEDREEKEGSRDENIISGAIMLITEYKSIMHENDVQNLVELIKEYDKVESYQKTDIIANIDRITDNNTDLFALYRLKSAADEALNGHGTGALGETNALADSNNLKQQHDQILSYFQTGKRDEGYALLNESIVIAMKYL